MDKLNITSWFESEQRMVDRTEVGIKNNGSNHTETKNKNEKCISGLFQIC